MSAKSVWAAITSPVPFATRAQIPTASLVTRLPVWSVPLGTICLRGPVPPALLTSRGAFSATLANA